VRAILTISFLPPISFPLMASRAFFWASSLSNSTNPKPLERPLWRVTTVAFLTLNLWSVKILVKLTSSISNGKLDTNNTVLDSVRGTLDSMRPPRPPRPEPRPTPRSPVDGRLSLSPGFVDLGGRGPSVRGLASSTLI